MTNQIVTTLLRLVESAVQGKPLRKSFQVMENAFQLVVSGNKEGWNEITKAAGVPGDATQSISDDTLICAWPSLADDIFGEGGILAGHLDNYEPREAQLHMARLVQRAIEMRQPAIIEAGTGTGKSFAYAAICMAMGKRVVISTSNKALQMQLYKKDVPFLQTIFPGKKMALVQGKNNYACRTKVEDPESGTVNFAISPPLVEWYWGTETGNTEEIPFAVDWQELEEITVDRYCTGKMCSRYHDCFYYAAKARRETADILITNHMLLALNHLYPGANILPEVDVIVVDEAHKLADYMRNAMGAQFQLSTITRRIDLAEKYDVPTTMVEELKDNFFRAVRSLIGHSTDRQIGIKDSIGPGISLANALWELADEVWEDGDMPNTPHEKRMSADADQIRKMGDNIMAVSQPHEKLVRWIEVGDTTGLAVMPFDVSEQIGALAGFPKEEKQVFEAAPDHTRCSRCYRRLTAETVNILEGLPYGPECIRHVDIFGDGEQVSLQEWLSREHAPVGNPLGAVERKRTPVVFTSATLAAPDMAAFMRECGIPDGLQMIAKSPFNYERNALLYVPAGASPGPRDEEFRRFLVNQLRALVNASRGGAFLLFTSYSNMRYAAEQLEWEFVERGYPVYVQGQLPKLEIVQRFLSQDNAVLFATKSFWEGVSIDGEALRLVVIDKLPFEAPSPLNQAQEAALVEAARRSGMREEKAKWVPFEALRVPRMITDLKQGTGRLIRTMDDYGVIAILDSRLRTAQYGRRLVLPSLPPAPLTHRDFMVSEFFEERRKRGVKLGDLSQTEQVEALAGKYEPSLDNPFGGV